MKHLRRIFDCQPDQPEIGPNQPEKYFRKRRETSNYDLKSVRSFQLLFNKRWWWQMNEFWSLHEIFYEACLRLVWDQFHAVLEGDVGDEQAHRKHDELWRNQQVGAEASWEFDCDVGEWFDCWCLSSTLSLAVASELLFVEQANFAISTLLLVFRETELVLFVLGSENRRDLTIHLSEQWDGVDLVLAVDGKNSDVTDLICNDEIIWKIWNLVEFTQNKISWISHRLWYTRSTWHYRQMKWRPMNSERARQAL